MAATRDEAWAKYRDWFMAKEAQRVKVKNLEDASCYSPPHPFCYATERAFD